MRGTPLLFALLVSATALLLIPVVEPGPHPAAVPSTQPAAQQPTPAAPVETSVAPPPPPALPAPGRGARTLQAAPVQLANQGYWSWALLSRGTGQISGSTNLGSRSDTASMIKVWIAADYLRRAGDAVPAARQRQLSIMIRDSDNAAASELHRANGGTTSIQRMIGTCGLTDSAPNSVGSWSTTMMSPRDAVRLGHCLATGRAAGPRWTPWLLAEMRQIRGAGRFGIIEAFGGEVAASIAYKNGWIARKDGKWHIACLAIGADWILSVMAVYPAGLGRGYGAATCRRVAEQLATG